MTSRLLTLSAGGALAWAALAAEKPMQLKQLPPVVQKAIADQLNGADIKGISMEKEKGVTTYEVESMMGGKHKDLTFNSSGSVVTAEDEVAIDSLPAPAQAAVMKKVGTGKLGMVESVKTSSKTFYEAHYTTKLGKKLDALVNADGSPAKED